MNTNSHGLLRRLLCLAVTLALIVSLAACTTPPDTTAGLASNPTQGTTQPATTAQPTTAPTTLPTTAPTEPTEPPTQPPTEPPTQPPTEPPTQPPTEPTEPTQPTEPEPNPYELVYELTQEDVDEYYRLLGECEALALVGEDLDAIDEATMALDESYEYLDAQCSIAMIQHYSHTADKALEQRYLDCVEICTQANDAYIQMTRRLYLSESPAKDHLFEGWTQQDFDDLMAYDEQISLLQQRNAEITVDYRTSRDDDARIALYIEFVQNNNQIAQYYGYDNYYTYAYERVYDRDYDADSLQLLRQYARTYLVDAYHDAYVNFDKSFYGRLTRNDQTAVINFLYEDYDTLKEDYVAKYIDSLPEEMAQHMRNMLEKDSLFTDALDAEAGAFTTTIGDRSYCYYGPGYASSSTVVHEGGHYYASRYTNLGGIPLDLAETHSQGNEWLFASFLRGKLPTRQYKALVDYLIYEDITMIMICLMVDEFEQQVYTTDLTGFTAADFNAIMDAVSLQYFPDGDVSSLTDIQSYWRQVVVEQPVYYISYGVSAMAAMSLFTQAEADFDAAMANYQKLCQEPLEDGGFLANVQAAGLYTPFDETFYQTLKALIENRR